MHMAAPGWPLAWLGQGGQEQRAAIRDRAWPQQWVLVLGAAWEGWEEGLGVGLVLQTVLLPGDA